MRQETINVYRLEELQPEIQKKVIERFRQNLDYPFLEEGMKEFISEKLNANRITPREVYLWDKDKGSYKKLDFNVFYSLGYSQGDGCCFVGTFGWKHYVVTIKHTGHYYHSNSVTFDFERKDEKQISDRIYEKVFEGFTDIYKSICKEAENYGYKYIEAEEEADNIKETIEINEYEFLGNGMQW